MNKMVLYGLNQLNLEMIKTCLLYTSLIGSGCGVPAIMASKTIEQDNDRRLTIMTATFIPCGAKLPVIALLGGVMAGKVAGWEAGGMIAPAMYFLGIVAVLVSAIILKKTKPFSGKPLSLIHI